MTNIVHVVVIIAKRNKLRDSDLPNSYLSKLLSEYLKYVKHSTAFYETVTWIAKRTWLIILQGSLGSERRTDRQTTLLGSNNSYVHLFSAAYDI